MADALLGAALQSLFGQLTSPQVVDFFMVRKLNETLLQKLKTTLNLVNTVLDDAEEKQITKQAVKKWVDDLKDAIYEADDLLDEIAFKALKSGMETRFRRYKTKVKDYFSSHFSFQEGINDRLEEIVKKLDELVAQRGALGLIEGNIGEKPSSHILPTTSLLDESGVCGRDNDKEVIMKLLLSDDVNVNNVLDVIPILGMAGVGKTTLAQMVYNDSRVAERFNFKAWVSVSAELDVYMVIKDILKEVGSVDCDNKNANQLQLELKERLKGKKLLLVLDDIWNVKYDHWDVLRTPLKSAHGSKVVVTTRIEDVASVVSTVSAHRLNRLSEDDCWSLFAKHAFHDRNSSRHKDLEEIGREMVKKCDGLPLAAKALGGLLRSQREVGQWEKILNSNIWSLPNSDILPAIRLSYHYLPSHLKRCFAYCAIFPKDYEFEKNELVLLWMAEGFLIQPDEKKPMEEVGDEYFNDLVSRSFFQRSSSYKSCFVMHNLISDLAEHVAGEFCFRVEGDISGKITERVRYLSYSRAENDSSEKAEDIDKAQSLHTFLFVEWSRIDYEIMCNLLSKLRRLRVLSLSQYHNMVELPGSIGKMKHLRYLNLSMTSIRSLPDIVGTLYKLQTLILHECIHFDVLPDLVGDLKCLRYLDLSGTSIKRLPKSTSSLEDLQVLILSQCKDLIELPNDMGRLANLHRLDITGTNLQVMPPQMGQLKNLQILTNFILGKQSGSSIRELGQLCHLQRKLCISNLENVINAEDCCGANLKGKNCLKELELQWNNNTGNSSNVGILDQLEPHSNIEHLSVIGYGGARFPDWVGHFSFSNIASMQLSGCKHCSCLPPLGQLVSLKDLSIVEFDGVLSVSEEFCGSCMSTNKPFQSLKILKLEKMPKWHGWVSSSGAFPFLQELYIKDCPNLINALPDNLPCLTTLEIEGCPKLEASLPNAPSILRMKLKDDSRDVLLVKLSSGLYSLVVDRFHSLDSLVEAVEQMGAHCTTFQEIEVRNCDSLQCFPLKSFSKLKTLRISRCSNLQFLFSPEATHEDFTSLSSLEIRECPNLASFPEGGLPAPKLTRLLLLGCLNVESFPGKTLLPSTLTSLKIWDFQNLQSLDFEGPHRLTSLRELEICNCPKLQSLPQEGLPASLSSLSVFLCPLLEPRCQRVTGEDWSKISHIPYIKISFLKIN